MKITTRKIKQIIKEELSRLEEFQQPIATMATAQDRIDDVNATADPDLIAQINHLLDEIVKCAAQITDPTMTAAITARVEGTRGAIDQINIDIKQSETPQMPDEHAGSVTIER
tara:strand:- start:383 stop:721 length:339 start_codon:yes stop_codon:yes gene_type:complete